MVAQLQLLFFALLAFGVLMRTGIHPPEIRAVNLDTDVVYRKFTPSVIVLSMRGLNVIWSALANRVQLRLSQIIKNLYDSHGPEGRIAQVWPTGSMVLWIALLLGVTLIVSFVT